METMVQSTAAVPGSELTGLPLAQAAAMIREGRVTSTQLTEAMLARIAAVDPRLNSYITVVGEGALADAQLLDHEQREGRLRGPLHGVPVALKDNIDTAGIPTTAASGVFRERIPQEDAEVTRRLKQAGAVILGKLNLHEFAAGGTGHCSVFGPARNPWNTEHATGGSSSGSGGAVAAELCFGALGTDTGGSIRIPSSWCGTVGLKPTYGLVSIRGIVPLIYTLDHCGPMARSVEDVALMLQVLAGYDPRDEASVEHPSEDYLVALQQPVHSLRLGAPEEFYTDLDPEVEAAMGQALAVLETLTAGIVSRTPLPPAGDLMQFLPEMMAYHEEHLRRTPELYQPATARFLQLGQPVPATDFVRAKDALSTLRRRIDEAFQEFDLVVLPTEKILPVTIAEAERLDRVADETGVTPPETFLTIANTYQFNMYGIPAISVPCGFSASGLPIGMTIAGPRFSEGRILALAARYEQATDWHKRRPALD